MYNDPTLNQRFFGSFSLELRKLASPPLAEAKEVGKLITKRDLLMAGIGAGTLYGGNRIVKDVAAGERIRKQQQTGGY